MSNPFGPPDSAPNSPTVTSLFTPPAWVPNGPNPVIISGGGGNWVEAWLIGNVSYSRAGGTSASASSGGGGWQVTDRTRQKAATEWLDFYPYAMTLKLRIDGNAGGQGHAAVGSVEAAIGVLESFEMPVPGSRPPLPPILELWGPLPHTELFWVCTRLTAMGGDDDVIRDASGDRTMQNFTMEITEYSPSSIVQSDLTPAQAAALVGATGLPGNNLSGSTTLVASGKTYTVVAGDTLQSIAANHIGNVNDWVNIALLNGLAYGSPLTPGQVLQLPAP